MQTTLDLPDALLKQVELRASHEGRKLNEVAADLLRIGLASEPVNPPAPPRTPAVISTDPQTGLPLIISPPGAPIHSMTIDQALALEQSTLEEEDLERAGLPLRH